MTARLRRWLLRMAKRLHPAPEPRRAPRAAVRPIPRGSLDYLMSPMALNVAARAADDDALAAALRHVGARPDSDPRALQLHEEQLVALIALVAADPRVAMVRVQATPEGEALARRYAALRKTIAK